MITLGNLSFWLYLQQYNEKMKESQLKRLTIAALIAIGLLQLVWVLHSYSLQKGDIRVKANEILFVAAEKELFSRAGDVSKKVPEGETLEFGSLTETGQRTEDFVVLQEIFSRFDSDISFSNLDSIFTELLCENEINVETSVYLVHKDSLNQNNIKGAFLKNTIQTDTIPIRKDRSLYIQATLFDFNKVIFMRIALLLIATAVMMFFIAYCITLQIRIIVKQNRIAQLRKDFSNAMIHDMKTPLTSIMVGTQVLESGKLDDSPEKKKKYLRIMKDETEHLLALANKVLALSKLESKEVKLDRQTVSLDPIISDLIEKFSVNASKKIEFVTHISAKLVYADPGYLKEIISNLIDNAIKYSGESVRIEITSEEEEKCDRISVKDNGIGIPLKDQSIIFEKFERAAATNRSSKGGATGFGLGLNYVLQAVEAHGGKVEIESIEDEYSEFTIYLPKLMEELSYDKTTVGGR